MRPLKYDCRLEESAFNISEMCRNESMLDFAFIGSNHATLFLRGGKFDPTNDLDDYMATIKFMMEWWNTSKEYNPLVNLTSPLENSAMIPFLQMANTSTKEFGCAYSICNSSDFFNTSNSSAFVSFVCQYGEPHIKMSTSN
ncbi:hypothetical protein KIN20_025024 [Parelaphostrongylus tenuis]|uniref:SCP domain-containing protein n=1 Tax=Parelaphostrongylus tenuis TaxID=148309 RepID=A0AAD5QX34_PARTN|nr:hypothetical protein KIN20_025024 [Parelaphostrongylus tenuis]